MRADREHRLRPQSMCEQVHEPLPSPLPSSPLLQHGMCGALHNVFCLSGFFDWCCGYWYLWLMQPLLWKTSFRVQLSDASGQNIAGGFDISWRRLHYRIDMEEEVADFGKTAANKKCLSVEHAFLLLFTLINVTWHSLLSEHSWPEFSSHTKSQMNQMLPS